MREWWGKPTLAVSVLGRNEDGRKRQPVSLAIALCRFYDLFGRAESRGLPMWGSPAAAQNCRRDCLVRAGTEKSRLRSATPELRFGAARAARHGPTNRFVSLME